MNETFSVAPGGQVLSYQPHGFNQIYGIWINNFSGGWIGIDGQNLWCPPYTRGWKATVFPGTSQITVRSYDFANGLVIAGATGQAVQVTLWSEPQGDSEGIAFFDEQTVPRDATSSISPSLPGIAPTTLIAAPAVGRLRIYEVNIYLEPGDGNEANVSVVFYRQNAPFIVMTILEVSPATPNVSKIFAAPQGDISIGKPFMWAVGGASTFGIFSPQVAGSGVTATVRYANI